MQVGGLDPRKRWEERGASPGPYLWTMWESRDENPAMAYSPGTRWALSTSFTGESPRPQFPHLCNGGHWSSEHRGQPTAGQVQSAAHAAAGVTVISPGHAPRPSPPAQAGSSDARLLSSQPGPAFRRRRHGPSCARESRPPREAPVETRDASAAAADLPDCARAGGAGRGGGPGEPGGPEGAGRGVRPRCPTLTPAPGRAPPVHRRPDAFGGPGCVGVRTFAGKRVHAPKPAGYGPAGKARRARSRKGVGTQA